MAVYNKDGGYTELAFGLSKELQEVLKPVLLNYVSKGMSIEEIHYVVGSVFDNVCLRNQIETRLKKKESIDK